MSFQQLRQKMTDEIVAALKAGVAPWVRPWRDGQPAGGLPRNAVTGRRYSGVNVIAAQLHQRRLGLRSPVYATFNQWKEMGCVVKARPKDVAPGRWGCGLVYCAPVPAAKAAPPAEAEDAAKERLVLRHYTVFAADQVEGRAAERFLVPAGPAVQPAVGFGPSDRAARATGADLRLGGDRAYYRRPAPGGGGDYIQVPHPDQFPAAKDYHATLWHELGHWSETRLGWRGTYPAGELRAEMTAAFALAELGVPQADDLSGCQSYLGCWLKAMAADPQHIFTVSADASRAVDFLLGFTRQPDDEPDYALAA